MIKNREVTKSREVPTWVPFPVDALPAPLAQLVCATSEAMGCDPAYVALPILAVCASAIGNSRTIQLNQSWTEPAVLWTVGVGESGSIKSPPFRLAMKPLYAIQEEDQAKHKAALACWKREHAIWKEHSRATKENSHERQPEPVEPTQARFFCSDITVERLAELLDDNPRGLLMSRDELSGWFNSFTKYKARGAGSDVPNWLEMYNANNITVDRKTGERRSILVERAAVSVTGTIQPGILARTLTTQACENDLTARLLLAWPPRRKKEWTESTVDEAVEGEYDRILRALLALTMRQTGESKSEPHRLQLSRKAKPIWDSWYESWTEVQFQTEGNLLATYAKIEAAAARLALVHHLVSTVHAGGDTLSAISAESMEAGVRQARWFAGEAERVYRLVTA